MGKLTKREAGLLGCKLGAAVNKEKAREEYYEDPSFCKHCGKRIDIREGEKPSVTKQKKFCDRSCAAAHNNKQRTRSPWSEDSRKRLSEKAKAHWDRLGTRLSPEERDHKIRLAKNPKKVKEKSGPCQKCGTDVSYNFYGRSYRKRAYCEDCLQIVRAEHAAKRMGTWSEDWKAPEDRTLAELKEESKGNYWQYRIPIQKHAKKTYARSNRPKFCVVCGESNPYQVCHKKPVTDFPDTATVKEINAITNLVALCPTHHWQLDHGILKFNGQPIPHPLQSQLITLLQDLLPNEACELLDHVKASLRMQEIS